MKVIVIGSDVFSYKEIACLLELKTLLKSTPVCCSTESFMLLKETR